MSLNRYQTLIIFKIKDMLVIKLLTIAMIIAQEMKDITCFFTIIILYSFQYQSLLRIFTIQMNKNNFLFKLRPVCLRFILKCLVLYQILILTEAIRTELLLEML